MPIFSGGGGGGLPLTGGTLTGQLTIDAGGIAGTDTLVALNDANSPGHTVIELDQDSRIYLNRFENTGRPAIQYDSLNNIAVFEVVDGGGVAVHADSGTIPLEIVARDTARPALVVNAMTAAPPDNTLNPGAFTFWLDQTNGAAKLMIKAKSANGTVVAAAIALA